MVAVRKQKEINAVQTIILKGGLGQAPKNDLHVSRAMLLMGKELLIPQSTSYFLTPFIVTRML